MFIGSPFKVESNVQLECTYGQNRHDKNTKDPPEVVPYVQFVPLHHLWSKISSKSPEFLNSWNTKLNKKASSLWTASLLCCYLLQKGSNKMLKPCFNRFQQQC